MVVDVKAYRYVVRQDGAEVVVLGLNDTQTRDKAHRIARRSLDTGKGDVEIVRNGRVVAVLTHKDRVAAGERWG